MKSARDTYVSMEGILGSATKDTMDSSPMTERSIPTKSSKSKYLSRNRPLTTMKSKKEKFVTL